MRNQSTTQGAAALVCTPRSCNEPAHAQRPDGARYPDGRSKWSCARFLDELRAHGDEAADQCFAALEAGELGERDFAAVFRHLNTNDARIPERCPTCGKPEPIPEVMKDLFKAVDEQARWLLDPTITDDENRGKQLMQQLDHGQHVFWTYAIPALLVYLTRSLPEGYAAPTFSAVLHLSGNLEHHTYRRLMGTLQMLVNVSSVGSFESRRLGIVHPNGHQTPGKAISTAKQLRLLHAGVRYIAQRHVAGELPANRPVGARTGVTGPFLHLTFRAQPHELRAAVRREADGAPSAVPVNREDLLATIVALSYLVIDGLRQLDLGLERRDEESLWAVWQTFARLMGIHPTDRWQSDAYVPANVDQADEFYRAYITRHYVGPGTERPNTPNKAGQKLGHAHLRMMRQHLMPRWLRWLPISRLYMQALIGKDGLRRIGLTPVWGQWLLRWLLLRLPAMWMRLVERVRPRKRADDAIEGSSPAPARPDLGRRPHGVVSDADLQAWKRNSGTQERLRPPFYKRALTVMGSVLLGHVHENLARLFFIGLIRREYGGEVTFLVPDRLDELRKLVMGRRHYVRRAGPRRVVHAPLAFPDRRTHRDRRSGAERRQGWHPTQFTPDAGGDGRERR